jgi:hypothetical protein
VLATGVIVAAYVVVEYDGAMTASGVVWTVVALCTTGNGSVPASGAVHEVSADILVSATATAGS